jgi:hypothetical protein
MLGDRSERFIHRQGQSWRGGESAKFVKCQESTPEKESKCVKESTPLTSAASLRHAGFLFEKRHKLGVLGLFS